ncbi:unnamed protein product [Boreogadus saida]
MPAFHRIAPDSPFLQGGHLGSSGSERPTAPFLRVDSPAGRLRRLSQHNELQAAQGETRASYGLRGWDHCVLCTEMRPSCVSAAMCEGLLQVPGFLLGSGTSRVLFVKPSGPGAMAHLGSGMDAPESRGAKKSSSQKLEDQKKVGGPARRGTPPLKQLLPSAEAVDHLCPAAQHASQSLPDIFEASRLWKCLSCCLLAEDDP